MKEEKFWDKYNIQNNLRSKNYDSLLNCELVDAVYISTPHTFHADLSIRAAGKVSIFCVKPGAVSFNKGRK